MRITFTLVLLLAAASAPEVRAQGAPWRPAPPRMEAAPPALPALDGIDRAPASLAAADPVRVEIPRDHLKGARIGSQYGAVAGLVIALFLCSGEGGEGNAKAVCGLAGLVSGGLAGAIVGAIIGAPPTPTGGALLPAVRDREGR